MQNIYKLTGDLTFDTVTDNFKRLKKMLRNSNSGKLSSFSAKAHDNGILPNDAEQTLQLNLQEVGHFDSAGLALLIEVKRLAARYNKKIEIKGASDNICALAKFYGLEVVLK